MAKKVIAVKVKDIDIGSPVRGAFYYHIGINSKVVEGIHYVCPCGCRRTCYLGFKGRDERGTHRWNGHKTQPTLAERVTDTFKDGRVHWEGELTNGQWIPN